MDTPTEYLTAQLSAFPNDLQRLHLDLDLFVDGPAGTIECAIVIKTHPNGEWIAATVPLVTARMESPMPIVTAITEALRLAIEAACPF